MSCPWAGILLLALQVAASQEGLWLQQSPAEIRTTPGQAAELNCIVLFQQQRVSWYKEHQDGSLQWVAHIGTFVEPKGRYSSKVNSTGKMFSLIINQLQEEDSGLYYCALDVSLYTSFGNGTRLIVSDAPQPSVTILAPSPPEEAESPDPIPLLCLLSPHARGWGAAVWDLGEGFPGQTDTGALDGEGTWSLTTVPRERWDTGMCCTCITREEGTKRNISCPVAKGMGTASEGPCWVARWVGLPCVCLLLLIQGLILFSAKCPRTVPKQRYSSKVSSTGKTHSLVINKLQEEDSGVYYCALDVSTHTDFANGTRLIVSDTPQPSLAILAPSPPEDTELPDPVPLLCLLFPHAQGWGAPLWDTGEDTRALDREGAWSLTTVPRKRWDAGTCWTCTAREKGTERNISAAVAKVLGTTSEGPCWVVRWVGLPCICLLLLMHSLILLSTKCPCTGRAATPGSNVRPRQSPETEYAAVSHGGRNVPE
ncbi:hypothetical protein Y1Q_0004526 [Alligator mississippiensis]|uniref:Ig-like domain-containing protein n=1 Tax=Alligator mississippiensis TaxID=8496 RepID=A0A151MAS5_ALLMI|nr:hypothetical protein Y1Q_0004526 [Alligator mississippiensis]